MSPGHMAIKWGDGLILIFANPHPRIFVPSNFLERVGIKEGGEKRVRERDKQ